MLDMDRPICRLLVVLTIGIRGAFSGRRLCDDDQIFTDSAGVKHCYVIHTRPSIRADKIEQTCTSLGGKAAALDTEEKIAFISNRSKSWFSDSRKNKYWIGAQTRWAWLGTKSEPTYTKWLAQNETSNVTNNYCAYLLDQTWRSGECGEKKEGFICETAKGPGGCTNGAIAYNECCFTILKGEKTYEAAVEACAEAGGYLAKLDSDGKNKDITNKINSSTDRFWFGLDRVYTWFWLDTGVVVQTATAKWKSGEPNVRDNCAVKVKHAQNEWESEKCDHEEDSIMCEHIPCIKDNKDAPSLFKRRYRNKKLAINDQAERVQHKARSPIECVSLCAVLYPCDCGAVEYERKQQACTMIVGNVNTISSNTTIAADVDIYVP